MTLLRNTLEAVRDRLDAAFQVADPRSEEWVTLANPVDLNGRASERASNKVVMMLAGLQTEKTSSNFGGPVPVNGDQFALVTPPLNLNLFLLFVANFSDNNYPTGLGMLSRVIAFFQQNPVFTPDLLPGLGEGADRIAVDFVSLDFSQTNHLMAMLGLKYLPSALYRMRTVSFSSTAFTAVVPRARAPDAGLLTK